MAEDENLEYNNIEPLKVPLSKYSKLKKRYQLHDKFKKRKKKKKEED